MSIITNVNRHTLLLTFGAGALGLSTIVGKSAMTVFARPDICVAMNELESAKRMTVREEPTATTETFVECDDARLTCVVFTCLRRRRVVLRSVSATHVTAVSRPQRHPVMMLASEAQ